MLKRGFDLLVLLLAAPLVLPLCAAIALLVRIRLGSPVFFTQPRGGYGGCRFNVWKFRSMTNACDENGTLLPDSQRLTRFGRWLRDLSLDELPCLWNVLRGDMSLVGPRPLIADYLPLYTREQMRRHDARPGITGWAQINGRNALSWEEKFALDLWYVDHRSFWLDLRILLQTILTVLRKDGIAHQGDVSMPRFTGTKPQQQKSA